MTSSTIKAIVFDYGNVLIDWNPRNVYRRFFPDDPEGMERFLQEINFMEWNAHQDRGRPFEAGVAILSGQFPQYAELIRAYHENWSDSIGDIYTGTIEILKKLKQAGYPLYGFSNWSAETFPLVRAKHDFFDIFDDMVISGEVGFAKPEPEIYQILLGKIGRPAHECLFIDDSLPNIQQANKIGFATIHFQSPSQLEKELKQLQLI